jgi:hypothetical protein
VLDLGESGSFTSEVNLGRSGDGCDINDLTSGECAPRNVVLALGGDDVLSSRLGIKHSDWDDIGRVKWVLGTKSNELVCCTDIELAFLSHIWTLNGSRTSITQGESLFLTIYLERSIALAVLCQ